MAATRKHIWTIVRLVLCVGFVWLAVRGVAINDRVTLAPLGESPDAPEQTFRLIGESATTITVLDAEGRHVEYPRSRIAVDETGSERVERGLLTALRSCNPIYLTYALLLFAPVTFLQSARFRLMLRAQDIRITYWESVKLCFAGNFLNFVFLVGSTAGDVYKAYYTAVHTEHKMEAVTTILLDRIVGMVGLLIVAGTMCFVGTADPMLRRLGITAMVLLGCVLVGLWMVGSDRAPARAFRRLVERLPGSAMTGRVMQAATRLAQQGGLLTSCVAIASVLQFLAVGAAVMLAYALGMDFSDAKVWDYFAYIGCGLMIAAIPITAQGLGTMELAYKTFFLGTYGTLAQLLGLALWIRLMNLLWALPGALVTLFGAHRPKQVHSMEDVASQATPETGSSV